MSTPTKQAVETFAQNSVPIPVGVSGLTFLGVTFHDWVFVGTAILLVFQLVVIFPKVKKTVRTLFTKEPVE